MRVRKFFGVESENSAFYSELVIENQIIIDLKRFNGEIFN